MDLFIRRLKSFWYYKDLLKQLVVRDVKLKYRRSFLGYVWSVLNPLLIMTVMSIVFSTMFKKETGQAYTAYLTEVRLNQAVELLRMTNDKTYVIAAKVGYQEQNYFSYVFKKRFGVSPTKYRTSQTEKKE